MKKEKSSQQKKAVGHIVYEVMMFHAAVLKLGSVTDQFEINILLESFAIHSRNLFDFFYTKKKRLDDITFDDYISQKKTFKSKRTKKKILNNLSRKANKQIAHLTYSRNNYNRSTKGWNVLKIYGGMNQTIRVFYECLDPEKKKWFKDHYDDFNPQG